MSLWRKRKTSDTVATDVHHSEQNQPKWANMTALANNDLSIKSWVGLTDEERNEILGSDKPSYERHISNMIEAKLKEKNA